MVNKSKSIPCQQPEDHLPREIEEKLESADGSRIHVLAVDDSFVERKIIEKLLKNSSYKVTTVDSASRALEILGVMEGLASSPPNAFKINLIITDYCMPGMTGYDLLKRVKTFASLKEIPVVIMSSENVPNRINTCLAEGAEEFLLKPVKIADVKRLQWHVRDKKQPSKRSHTDSACTDNRTASEILTVASSGSSECMKRKASFQDAQEDRITERRPRQIGVT